MGQFVEPHTTLTEAIEQFDLDNAARRLTRSTRTQYSQSLRVFTDWCAGNDIRLVVDVTPSVVRQYLVNLSERLNAQGTPLSAEYVHGLARAVRRLFSFCADEGLVDKSPFTRIKMPKLPERVLTSLTPGEIQSVIQACKTRRDRAIVMLLIDTGIRANELCGLDVVDCDLDDGALLIRRGKGQKERYVYAGAKVRAAIRAYRAQRGQVLPNAPLFATDRGGRRMTTNGIVQLMRRLQERSGVQHATAHTLRRTFAIQCLRSGMDIHSLRLLMGHQDEFMLRKYLAFTQGDLKAAHDRHSPIDHL